MFLTQILFTLHDIFQLLDTWYGNGRHIEFLEQRNAEYALKYWYICGIFYIAGTSLLKVAVGALLLRFVMSTRQRYLVYSMNVSAIVVGLAYLTFYLCLCRPMSLWWNLDNHAQGHCISASVFLGVADAAAGLNAVADGAFAILPAVIVWRTSMDRRTKIVVSCLLGFGSLACIGTLVRIGYSPAFTGYKGDFLYETAPIAVLSTIELGVGIVVANLATLRPILKRFFSWVSIGSSHVRTVPFDVESAVDRRIRAIQRTSIRKSKSTRKIQSLTGRESISGMPDLILVEEIRKKDLMPIISEHSGETSRSNSPSPLTKVQRLSRFTMPWPSRQRSRSQSVNV
ncbi:hypothetical protein CAC42_6115 [Sphaceloma murrayae]|uniref:Rhodopsin domain-containing protein n=1 Tax=Sphaceloma murrayae TaxID=2082308 RepID=A0A2K1QVN9_9PEZI|nr:hypothetical protein CAC42_6115 [Sphaceloma murrayae]